MVIAIRQLRENISNVCICIGTVCMFLGECADLSSSGFMHTHAWGSTHLDSRAWKHRMCAC